uniref:Inner centromere protein ARK-binding domain-containing protein n=1 Tax=Callorhinchus milii TaxID=7868 RepID=A0A4W3IGL7_CALMI
MAFKTVHAMVDTDNLLKIFGEKLEFVEREFKENHKVWLEEIQEVARKMFISDFSAEPELMPKTPSEKKRRCRRRQSSTQDVYKRRFSRSRKSLRRSSVKHLKVQSQANEEDCSQVPEGEVQPVRLTRAATRSMAAAGVPAAKRKVSSIVSVNGRVPLIELSLNDCKNPEMYQKGQASPKHPEVILLCSEDDKYPQKEAEAKILPSELDVLETVSPIAPGSSRTPGREASKLKIASAASKESTSDQESEIEQVAADSDVLPETDECVPLSTRKPVRRSTRRSSFARLTRYSLSLQRSAISQEAIRKSIRKSASRRRSVLEYSTSSSDIKANVDNVSDQEQQEQQKQEPAAQVPEAPEYRVTRSAKRIAISSAEPAQKASGSETQTWKDSAEAQEEGQLLLVNSMRKSYKRAVAEVYDETDVVEGAKDSPPRKRTPSPPCPAAKVIRPMSKTFLQTVQRNQLLMTPMSLSRTMVKSFIKRSTPIKVDTKEKERVRLAKIKKKQEMEEERLQRVEEERKRKLEEVKKALGRALDIKGAVRVIVIFHHQVREERIAEEKAKKKVAAKRMEEAEARRRQEEEARKQKLQQLEEEERKREELLQRKKEEEQERQRKLAEARKLQEQRQAQLEKEQQQRDLHLAAERELERRKEQERIQAERERERLEKEKALQLQRELERTAREDAALEAQREKERIRKEAQEREQKREEQRLAEFNKQRLEKKVKEEQERLQRENQEMMKKERDNENKLREEQERKWKEEQDRKAKEAVCAGNKNMLNVTVDVHSPATESYIMTPKNYSKPKMPKINVESYGMDLASDDSTDDEVTPRKPIPAWANGKALQQQIMYEYYHPIETNDFYGVLLEPRLEHIFGKSKPRYFRRTSSAVWHSPPQIIGSIFGLKKY